MKIEPEICALLRTSPVEQVAKKYHLFFARYDGLVLFCYNNLRSPRIPMTCECRGLILVEETLQTVCWPMNRFYNSSEKDRHELEGPLRLEEKVDGTQVNLFYSTIHHRWMAATRHTFCEQDKLYQDLLLASLGNHVTSLDEIPGLDRDITYCLEVCSMENRVVRKCPKPTTFLLAAFDLKTHHQSIPDDQLDIFTAFERPIVYNNPRGDETDPQAILTTCCQKESLFEGLVLKDCHFRRQKLKSSLYSKIHKLKYRGFRLVTPDLAVPLILSNQHHAILEALQDLRPDEVDEIKARFDKYEELIDGQLLRLGNLWKTRVCRETDRRKQYEICRDSGLVCADILLRKWTQDQLFDAKDKPCDRVLREILSSDPPKWCDYLLKKKNLLDANNPHSRFLSASHGPRYCMPTKPPPEPGVAPHMPSRLADGSWHVECPCGQGPMKLRRLKCDSNRYRLCHCGERIGIHCYRSGLLLWQCDACGADHEAHQRDGQWTDKAFTAGQPLGVAATAATKRWQLHVHEFLDEWKRQSSHDEAYQFLADGLGLSRHDAHVSLFDARLCYRAIQLLSSSSPSTEDSGNL